MDAEKEYTQEWCPDEDDADVYLEVRIKSVWDEGHFLRMERTANSLLDELQHEPGRRERWRYAFTDGITMLRHLLRHPGFLAMNELSMTKEQYRAYIERRVERLEALKRRYEAISGT